jgi:two-component system, OmpR family, phosphate regulon response regulator PhoB
LILTAKGSETDQIVGLSIGADDYVTKPCSMRLLIQRIKTLQRRTSGGAVKPAEDIEHLGVQLDRVRHVATFRGHELELTLTEFRILQCLLRQPGRVFTRQQLIAIAIGEGSNVLERTIDIHIKSLRRKLGDPDLIETVRGVGYRFRE